MHVLQCWCGKNNWSWTDDSPFTDCNQTQFCCQWKWKFLHSLFCLLNITRHDLVSGSFHLLQDPGYRVWSLASHTKRSVSASTWYQWLHFLPVLGKHLLVKTGICRSSRGSECLNTYAYQSILQWYELCSWHGIIFQQSDDYSCLSHSYPADWTSRQSSADAARKMSETCL